VAAVHFRATDAFHSNHHVVISFHHSNNRYTQYFAAKGFGGGGGFAAASSSGSKKKGSLPAPSSSSSKQTLLKKVEKKYGGSSPQDIARGTQVLIDQSIQRLPQHMQLALQLHRQQIDWTRRIAGMDVLAQSQLPSQMVAQAQLGQEALETILNEHSMTIQDLQKTMQEITWDASADAKAVKSLTGTMPRDVQNRVQRACDYAAEAVKTTGNNTSPGVLDVGCGYGVLVPFLKKAGIPPSSIHGMDLSSEMIKNAQSFYPNVHFEVNNFLELPDKVQCSAVVFCSSLHDLPDMQKALEKACSLLMANGGRLVIVHPQGASHVAQQHKSNPVLVPRGLPTAEELQEWLCSSDDRDDSNFRMELNVAPAEEKSQQEIMEGYLAVLTKL
jgi:SAM-dependent methyltransferase